MAEFRGIEDGFVGEAKVLFKTVDMSIPKYVGGYDITGNKGVIIQLFST